MELEQIQKLTRQAEGKIIMLVLDGLGGIPLEEGGASELEAARTPNLDQLATRSVCGLQLPVGAGVTPGSGAGHLALFGYDPLRYQVGRGVLAALGVGFPLQESDVAARGNFCTVDADGVIKDRRAGRIATELNRVLCARLREVTLPGVELYVEPVKEHRFLLVLRGEGLSGAVDDTDPQETGHPPLAPHPRSGGARRTAQLLAQFIAGARDALAREERANMVLLRGLGTLPDWPRFSEVYGLRAAAVAGYPMYRGVARLIGMDVTEGEADLGANLEIVKRRWSEHDFFFVHFKGTDSSGEDGDFPRKVAYLEEIDQALPRLLDLGPEVVVITGDHSTPCALKSHSWHPVPVLLWSPRCRPDLVRSFGERACITGALGPRLPATDLMPLALANALRLNKFGA